MLRHIRPLRLGVFNAPVFTEIEVNDVGEVKEKTVKSNRKLPKASTTDVELLEKSGIPVKRTKTKILSSKRAVQVSNELEMSAKEETQTN